MGKYFGTDGVRGVANQKLTPELAFQIGQAAGRWLMKQPDLPKSAVLGRDTRRSGPMLGAALAAGFCSAGVNVNSMGIVPTGCVTYIARTGEYGMGAVISASHNPAPDNGIKMIAATGKKVSAEVEAFIEEHLELGLDSRPVGGEVGALTQDRSAVEEYLNWLVEMVPERLEGMTVAIDGSQGAAFELGVTVFERLGAKVITTGCTPDGMNINFECGATHPATIQALAQESQATFGVAYDGDADRAVFSDDQGRLINGDRTMAIWCAYWKSQGQLNPPYVVGTVMSNGGFEEYMRHSGIELVRVDVGDKYVSAKLTELSGKVGGEQSGHIIFSDHVPTGDGLVTALQFARVLKREGKTAAELYESFDNWPQVLVNLEVDRKDGWEANERLKAEIGDANSRLSSHGRLNVRASGTQPILRVMVEASDAGLRDEVADRLVSEFLDELGGKVYSRVDLTHALGD
ncbi:MAG: phosphoglucosamine mutase [Fimbriimonadaceae bacterium]|nr:phosphoglucosamine mutase [Fimbriimonadaceae bacterium]